MTAHATHRAGRSWAAAIAALSIATVVAAPARAQTHEVVIEGMQFAPASLTVQRGDKVVWRNKDLVPHTATAKGQFDSGNIAPGKSWTYTANKTGRYEYVCQYHPGMKATLVVQ